MAIQIKKSEDYSPSEDILKVFVTGDYGTGKSVFASTFPQPGFVFNFDKKISVYRGGEFDYTEYPISAPGWNQFKADHKEVTELVKAGKYKTVIYDSTSAMQDIAMEQALMLDPKRSETGGPIWNVHYMMVRNLLEGELRKAISLPCNIVVIAHLETKKDEKGNIISIDPMLTGQLSVRIPGYFDEVYCSFSRVVSENGKSSTKYFLRTVTQGLYKARSGLSGKWRLLPDIIPNSYNDVFAAYKQEVERRNSSKQKGE